MTVVVTRSRRLRRLALGALVVALLVPTIVVAVITTRLLLGDRISLDWLQPILQRQIAHALHAHRGTASAIEFQVERPGVAWSAVDRAFDIGADRVAVRADGETLVELQGIALSISGKALFSRGAVLPSRLAATAIRLVLVRDAQGGLRLGSPSGPLLTDRVETHAAGSSQESMAAAEIETALADFDQLSLADIAIDFSDLRSARRYRLGIGQVAASRQDDRISGFASGAIHLPGESDRRIPLEADVVIALEPTEQGRIKGGRIEAGVTLGPYAPMSLLQTLIGDVPVAVNGLDASLRLQFDGSLSGSLGSLRAEARIGSGSIERRGDAPTSARLAIAGALPARIEVAGADAVVVLQGADRAALLALLRAVETDPRKILSSPGFVPVNAARAAAALALVGADGRRVPAEVSLRLRPPKSGAGTSGSDAAREETDEEGAALVASLGFGPDRPAHLAEDFAALWPDVLTLSPVREAVQRLDAPVAVTLSGSLTASGALLGPDIEISLGAGQIDMRPKIEKPVRIDGVGLTLEIRPDRNTLSLPRGHVHLTEGGKIALAARMGPDPRDPSRRLIRAEVDLRTVPVPQVHALWPLVPGDNSRAWVLANIAGGEVSAAKVTAAATAPQTAGLYDPDVFFGELGSLDIDDVQLSADLSGIGVRFLDGVPPVEAVNARTSLDLSKVRFDLSAGALQGIKVTGGFVEISGFAKKGQDLAMQIDVAGPVRDTIEILSYPRFGYAQKAGLLPRNTGGSMTGRLGFQFPLLNALKLEEVGIDIAGQLKDARVAGIALGKDVTDLDASLTISNKRLTMDGRGALGGNPLARARWEEVFAPKPQEVRTRISAAGSLTEAARRGLGIPDLAPFLTGPAGVEAELRITGAGRTSLAVTADLAPATLALGIARYEKPPGVAGSGTLMLGLGKGGRLERLGDIEVTAGSGDDALRLKGGELVLSGIGTPAFSADGIRFAEARLRGHRLEDLAITFPTVGRPASPPAPGRSGRSAQGLVVAVGGGTLDLGPFLGEGQTKSSGGLLAGVDLQPQLPWPLSVTARLQAIRLGPGGNVGPLSLRLEHDGRLWQRAELDGSLSPAKPISLIFARGAPAPQLQVKVEDLGLLTRRLDLGTKIQGGALSATAALLPTTDPADPAAEGLKGRLELLNYRLTEAPAVARLLSFASLTGLFEQLSGPGLPFDRAEADFTFKNKRIDIRRGRTYSTALGVTVEGVLNLEHDLMDLRGTVAPAYLLSRVVGAIPLVGDFLTGGRGEGLFAGDFSAKGPIGAPEIGVNPLAALAPGPLRSLFGVFDSTPSAEPQPGAAPGATSLEPQGASPAASAPAPASAAGAGQAPPLTKGEAPKAAGEAPKPAGEAPKAGGEAPPPRR